MYGIQRRPNETWGETVHAFDAEACASSVAATGARYAFTTMQQGCRHVIAPSKVYDRLTGNANAADTTRGLVLDVHAAFAKRGLKLMLYWTSDGPRIDRQAITALGWPAVHMHTRGTTGACRRNSPRFGWLCSVTMLRATATRFPAGGWMDATPTIRITTPNQS